MKEKEPMMDIDEVEEVDIENMSMEELREFIAAAEAEVILQFNRSALKNCFSSNIATALRFCLPTPSLFKKLTNDQRLNSY